MQQNARLSSKENSFGILKRVPLRMNCKLTLQTYSSSKYTWTSERCVWTFERCILKSVYKDKNINRFGVTWAFLVSVLVASLYYLLSETGRERSQEVKQVNNMLSNLSPRSLWCEVRAWEGLCQYVLLDLCFHWEPGVFQNANSENTREWPSEWQFVHYRNS